MNRRREDALGGGSAFRHPATIGRRCQTIGPPMSAQRFVPAMQWLGRLALASSIMLVACSSDTPTSPTAASRALVATAPTIALSQTTFHFCYPLGGGTRVCRTSGSLSITNSGGGTL